MKIAIPTDDKKGLQNTVAEHFGRAKNFLIYDTETESFEIYQNPEIAGKAEFPPDFLHRQKTETIIVFSLGYMAYKKFKNYNVKMHKADKGTIAENLQKFEDNKLKELTKKDIF
jgi:predicted Fe-Mo cluster-binding NifX family protein